GKLGVELVDRNRIRRRQLRRKSKTMVRCGASGRRRNFGGKALHSSQYDDGEVWKGKNVLVIGSGNSGHDIAQDLHSAGAKVTLVQRSSTMIVNVEPSAQLQYALYDEGPSLEYCDLITTSMPLHLV